MTAATDSRSADLQPNPRGGGLDEERGEYVFPPGLQRNLPLYLASRFFRPGNPILLFEHLVQTYGRVSHYKLGWNHIVFVNDAELIREILINQPQNFIKERTQRRMKILLGEGLITSDGEIHKRQRRIAAPAFHPPTRTRVDSRLVVGALLFGVGWGLVGYCPGPALAGLLLGLPQTWLFVAAMLAGMGLVALFDRPRA